MLSISLADAKSGAPLRHSPARPPSDKGMARKLRAVKNFVRKHSTELEQVRTRDVSQIF